MEPLMPSEIARLVYGYLKKESNEVTAECFLKTSPHLSECYQMYKANRNFNIKVNGFHLHDIFDIFGTMCSMINGRTPETCETKSLIEKLQYLLDVNHKPINVDKCVETELNMVDKCTGCTVNTVNKSTHITVSEENKTNTAVLEIPTFSEKIFSNVSKTKEIDSINEISKTAENPCLSSPSKILINDNGDIPSFSKFGEKESSIFQINDQISSTPAKKVEEIRTTVEPIQYFSPKNDHNQLSQNQSEYQQIPEATSLESMPGLSKEDRIKDSSVIIDTGELIDTFLSDQSLLEKFADTINKSIEIQKETSNVHDGQALDPPSLEKAIDSTQSEPQIKNVLDEFLVFNVDNVDDGKKSCSNAQNSIKSRLRSAKCKDDVSGKRKNNLSIQKHANFSNEEYVNVDSNIVFVNDNIGSTIFGNCNLLSNNIFLQTNDSNVEQSLIFDKTQTLQDENMIKSNYVKIAPKISTGLNTHQVPEKSIFPKRKRRSLQVPSIRSNFRKSNFLNSPVPPPTSIPIQSPQTIIIEVPNQNSLDIQAKNNEIIKLTEVSKVNDTQDTPDDTVKPPKNKSMSTPRRRSTHIRCLDFSTPQPKSTARDQARSKLFCDSPKRCEKILEEPSSSPLPKLQADWGSVNGYESIIKKDNAKHWDTDIRDMVGAGILTSDADGRKSRNKKTPRKKIKSASDKSNSELINEEKDNSILTNESTTDETNQTNISEEICNLNDENSSEPLLDDQKSLKEQSEKVTEICNEEPSVKSDSLKSFNYLKSLINPGEIPVLLETPDKVTELYNEKPLISSDSLKNLNDSEPVKLPSEFPLSLDTPDKVTELINQQPSIISNSFKNLKDPKSPKEFSEFPVSLEIPNKFAEVGDKPLPIESNLHTNSCKTQSNLEKFSTNIKEQENNLNQSNTMEVGNMSTISKTLPEITKNCDEKNSTICNNSKSLTFKLPENKKTEPIENFNKHESSNQIKTNNSSELNSPNKLTATQPAKKNQLETPYKCDDSAVDVPETPISKLIREYDPSKLVTPLPCTPEHYEDSLTETPLTKVFRETSYLNRPPISPFPPTPGNSMSVDTLIVPLEQENSKMSNSTSGKINGLKEFSTQPFQSTTINTESSAIKKKINVKSTPLKAKQNVSTKKNGFKGKNSVSAKKVYESVKIELFGNMISSSSSADELEKSDEHNNIVIIKKPPENLKKTGFKPIPKRKSIQSPYVPVNKLPLTKPTFVQNEKIAVEKAKITSNIKKSKKSMVHFDDPVQEVINTPAKKIPYKTNYKNEIQNQTMNIEKPEQLVGLSRYLNKSSSFYERSPTKKSRINPVTNTYKLNNSDSIVNYSKMSSTNKTKLPSCSNNATQALCINNKKNKVSEKCTVDENNKSDKKNNSIVLVKSKQPLDYSIKSASLNTKISDGNFISKKDESNINFDKFELSTLSHNSSLKNTSCVTVGHNDELEINLKKENDRLKNIEYLKKPKVYEVITEDGEREMVCLKLSETFVFLNIPSEVHNVSQSNSISSPLIVREQLDVIPELETGELESDDDKPITSTPKDIEKQDDQKQMRSRRSPSFWEDSLHNYPSKHRDDRHRESNRYSNNFHRDNRNNKKYWSHKRYHDNHGYSRFQRPQGNIKREFSGDHLVRDNERSKYRDDKRRNYRDFSTYDDRKARDRLEEPERFSSTHRKSQNEKLNRTEDVVKKATKRPLDRDDFKIPPKVSKVEHQRLLRNVDVDEFLCVVHGRK